MIPLESVATPGVFAALAAGLLSFLSPCVLPLIPVYLSFISGESASALGMTGKKGDSTAVSGTGDGRSSRSKRGIRAVLLIRTLFFVAGFTLVFTALAIIFGGGMKFIGSSATVWINRGAGVLVIVLGLNTLFDFIPFLRGEYRISEPGAVNNTAQTGGGKASAARFGGPLKAVLLGMAFAAGWTPCVGPILSSILLFAGQDGNAARAALLLAAYSAGLGIPFILTGLFLDRAAPVLGWFKKHMTAVKIVSGLLLIGFGIALLAGSLSGITVFFLKAGYAMEELAQTGPAWFRPVAGFFSRWFTFQGA